MEAASSRTRSSGTGRSGVRFTSQPAVRRAGGHIPSQMLYRVLSCLVRPTPKPSHGLRFRLDGRRSMAWQTSSRPVVSRYIFRPVLRAMIMIDDRMPPYAPDNARRPNTTVSSSTAGRTHSSCTRRIHSINQSSIHQSINSVVCKIHGRREFRKPISLPQGLSPGRTAQRSAERSADRPAESAFRATHSFTA